LGAGYHSLTGSGGSDGSDSISGLIISSFSQALINVTEIKIRNLRIHVVSESPEK
jgi:hypothetical protein